MARLAELWRSANEERGLGRSMRRVAEHAVFHDRWVFPQNGPRNSVWHEKQVSLAVARTLSLSLSVPWGSLAVAANELAVA